MKKEKLKAINYPVTPPKTQKEMEKLRKEFSKQDRGNEPAIYIKGTIFTLEEQECYYLPKDEWVEEVRYQSGHVEYFLPTYKQWFRTTDDTHMRFTNTD